MSIKDISQEIRISCDVLVELICEFRKLVNVYNIAPHNIDIDKSMEIDFDIGLDCSSIYRRCIMFRSWSHILTAFACTQLGIEQDSINYDLLKTAEDWWYSVIFYNERCHNAFLIAFPSTFTYYSGYIKRDYVIKELKALGYYSSSEFARFANCMIKLNHISTDDELLSNLVEFIRDAGVKPIDSQKYN